MQSIKSVILVLIVIVNTTISIINCQMNSIGLLTVINAVLLIVLAILSLKKIDWSK